MRNITVYVVRLIAASIFRKAFRFVSFQMLFGALETVNPPLPLPFKTLSFGACGAASKLSLIGAF